MGGYESLCPPRKENERSSEGLTADEILVGEVLEVRPEFSLLVMTKTRLTDHCCLLYRN